MTDVRYPSEDHYGQFPPGTGGGADTGFHPDLHGRIPQPGYDAPGAAIHSNGLGGGYAGTGGGWGDGTTAGYTGYSGTGYTGTGYDGSYAADATRTDYGTGFDGYGQGYVPHSSVPDTNAYHHPQDTGVYAVPETQGWSTGTAVQDSQYIPGQQSHSEPWQQAGYHQHGHHQHGYQQYSEDPWPGHPNTGVTAAWYAASDTAAWESDTWLWGGGNRGTTDLFDAEEASRAPADPPAPTVIRVVEPVVYDRPEAPLADDRVIGDEDGPDGPEETTVTAAPGTSPRAGSRNEDSKRASGRTRRPLPRVAGAPLAIMGVAAMAVAAAGGVQLAGAEGNRADTVADGADLPLLSPLDQQLVDVRDGAEEFAERASRAQARVALEEREEEIERQEEAERKRIEAERPKFFLPVTQKGLSAYFGASGSRWSNTHTGIDFPVDYGTPIRAVTDGVVRTEWDRFYGNMVIVTAKDGTETWYCHLTRAKVRSGPVKAGDVIAYSGNSGNSTGPHLHLEVRPDGGAPVNPLSWLRARGLDPT